MEGEKRMQKFICEQNIAHFQKRLGETTDVSFRRMLESLLSSAKRELAVLNSMRTGVDASPLDENRRRQLVDTRSIRLQIQSEFDRSLHPYMLLDPGPGLKIIDINAAYAAATFISRSDVVGKSIFDVFPDNPADALADGVSNLYASLKIVAETDRPHVMAIQRYDMRDPNGGFVERHWQPINSPIHDSDGQLVFLLHHVEDVTAQVRCRSGEHSAQQRQMQS
jgi:PAS domain-containing protein